MSYEKLLPIRDFLERYKGNDRILIPDSDLGDLVSLFAEITNIYMDMSWRNPLSVMETLTVALCLVISNQDEAAYILRSSKNTVKTYQARAKIKLNTESKIALISKAIHTGLITIR